LVSALQSAVRAAQAVGGGFKYAARKVGGIARATGELKTQIATNADGKFKDVDDARRQFETWQNAAEKIVYAQSHGRGSIRAPSLWSAKEYHGAIESIIKMMVTAQKYLESHMGSEKFSDTTDVSVPDITILQKSQIAYSEQAIRKILDETEQDSLLADKNLIINLKDDIADEKCRAILQHVVEELQQKAKNAAEKLIGKSQQMLLRRPDSEHETHHATEHSVTIAKRPVLGTWEDHEDHDSAELDDAHKNLSSIEEMGKKLLQHLHHDSHAHSAHDSPQPSHGYAHPQPQGAYGYPSYATHPHPPPPPQASHGYAPAAYASHQAHGYAQPPHASHPAPGDPRGPAPPQSAYGYHSYATQPPPPPPHYPPQPHTQPHLPHHPPPLHEHAPPSQYSHPPPDRYSQNRRYTPPVPNVYEPLAQYPPGPTSYDHPPVHAFQGGPPAVPRHLMVSTVQSCMLATCCPFSLYDHPFF
jgi:hypothetical protein